MLLRNSGRVLTRMQLIDRVWGSDYVGDTKTLDVHVKRLRAKIEPDPANPRTSSPCAGSATSSRRPDRPVRRPRTDRRWARRPAEARCGARRPAQRPGAVDVVGSGVRALEVWVGVALGEGLPDPAGVRVE